jgi:hypothetical protein
MTEEDPGSAVQALAEATSRRPGAALPFGRPGDGLPPPHCPRCAVLALIFIFVKDLGGKKVTNHPPLGSTSHSRLIGPQGPSRAFVGGNPARLQLANPHRPRGCPRRAERRHRRTGRGEFRAGNRRP